MAETEAILNNGVTVVTGAGVGLGRALSIELVQRGCNVVGFARSRQNISETAKLAGSGFTEMVVDVADPQAVARAFVKIEKHRGPVTRLINNAAVYPREDFLDQTPQEFSDVMNVNLGGIVNCSHRALQGMVETGLGRIVNVASFADIAPLPASSAYSVSKGAGRILTRAMVADLGDRFPGIVISDWLPGILATRMGIPDGLKPEDAAKWGAPLVLWHDPSLNGAVFEMGTEVLPPRSLKRRLLDKALMRTPVARVLTT